MMSTWRGSGSGGHMEWGEGTDYVDDSNVPIIN